MSGCRSSNMADLSELFDDDDIDDDVLLGLPLEYPYPSSEKQNPVKQPVVGAGVSHLITDSDSGLGSNDGENSCKHRT